MIQKTDNSFFSRVYEIVARIPWGKVVSYGQIAAFLGSPKSSRMVGWAMHAAPSGIPWYRVVMKTGKLPFDGATFDNTSQKELLVGENVTFLENGLIDMKENVWQIQLPL